jgi:lipoprotein NlpI
MPRLASLTLAALLLAALPGFRLTAQETPESLLLKATEARREAQDLALRAAAAFDRRGGDHFVAGRIKESVADFDMAVKLDPKREPWHWRRGISYYYAGEFEKGKKQFEGYQTVDSSDVENATWRYLCMARLSGVAEASKAILKIGDDRRVPMRQIYDLYAGKLKPEDVLKAATAGKPPPPALNMRLFYAHLYLGLYYEAAGREKLARKHLYKAADDHRIGHYMWDVAHVHANILRAKEKKK